MEPLQQISSLHIQFSVQLILKRWHGCLTPQCFHVHQSGLMIGSFTLAAHPLKARLRHFQLFSSHGPSPRGHRFSGSLWFSSTDDDQHGLQA